MKSKRKPTYFRKFLKPLNINQGDVRIMIKNVLFAYSERELRDIMVDTDRPMIIRLFIRAFLQDFKTGKLVNFESLMNRVFGQPTKYVESNDTTVDVANLPREERDKLLESLVEKYKQE